MDEMFAIKCQNCGGPMYSHQAKRSFECAYCGTVVPWQADAGERFAVSKSSATKSGIATILAGATDSRRSRSGCTGG